MTQDPEGGTNKAYAVRQGTLFLHMAHEDHADNEDVVGRICDALKADSRVSDLIRPPVRAHDVIRLTMYPRGSSPTDEKVLNGNDHLHCVRLSDPIAFRLRVPPENQKEFRGKRGFSPEYHVAWDGITLAVLWEHSPHEYFSVAAGRIVFDVLIEACAKAELGTYAQACSPGCENRFTHRDVLLTTSSAENVVKANLQLDVLTKESLLGPSEELTRWHMHISSSFLTFARYKSYGRRLRDLQYIVNRRMEAMVGLQQKHAASVASNLFIRTRNAVSMRGWRRMSGKYMADMWLALASIDLLRRQWQDVRRKFNRDAERQGTLHLFERDYSDDEAAVESIDLTLPREAMQNFATRLDSRMVVMVTAVAGIAGASGGVIGAVLTASK